MAIKESRGDWEKASGIHGGKGDCLLWWHFKDKVDSNLFFIDCVLKPGAYGGYHRHDGDEEIYYVLSGQAEYAQDGEVAPLGPGDATLVKSGHCHAIRNAGNDDLRLLVFCAGVQGGQIASEDLPLPQFISHWDNSRG